MPSVTTSEGAPEAVPDVDRAAEDRAGGDRDGGRWLAEELQRALERLDELTHELARVQVALQSQQAEAAHLRETLAVVEGRTRRHESGQDAARELRQESGALAERIEAEAALRRDLTAAVTREAQREHEQRGAAERRLEEIGSRLEQIEHRLASDGERRESLTAGLAERGQQEQALDARVEALERAAAAAREALRSVHEELARATAALPALIASVDDQGERARAAGEERSRLEGGLAALRAERERETQLLEVVEQQRATRQRLEERLVELDESLEAVRRDLAAAAEERALTRQQTAGNRERLTELAEAMEGQRDAIVEHFRRWTEDGAQSGRRQIEEIERANRAARDLLVRLTERSDEATREQPL